MAERSVTLEERLAALAATMEYPATPAAELRARVTAAIRVAPPRAPIPPVARARWRSWRVRLAAALAVLLAVTGLVTPVRTAVAGFLGLRGVVIEQPRTVPTPTPRPPTATPSPAGLGAGLSLGEPTSLPAARAQLAFTPLVPGALPAPDGVFVRRPPTGGALSLAYRAGPGRPPAIGDSGVAILITEFRGDLAPEFFGKFVGSDATIEPVQVDGDPGYWIAGTPHSVGYHEQNGDVQIDDLRLATNTLIWQHGNLLLRIEGTQTREQALAIAHSMH
ncbi:MAG TPA: hypothetical protein VI316_01100 [Candidatus Dormibacteraeota bacterium]